MDRRSWPWKKKSSDKTAAVVAAAASDSAGASAGTQNDQDKYKKPNYVQITVESYSHLTGLEDQVKTYDDQVKTYEDQVKTLEDEVKELNEKLSEAHSDMTTKESLVKQHAKVAEEAVSGWEKAESEALALKNHLESVTLLKLTAEDRASHLDGALKECMRQIRNLKEEHEHKLHEVVLTKTKQCDKIKLEFEAKIAKLDQELLRSAAENAALSRSLQERSNMLVRMSEEKSQAEAEIELLKSNIESCEKEINSLKYELHIVAKELEIRNEEKNMSVRSAEVANKQHLEGVKKIAKLEAECQRLRGLVRKKLPGPAALAQMKLEVENLGRDYGETRLRRSPVKPSTPHLSSLPEFSIDSVNKCHKDNEFLTERLWAMEEETKMLKEALAKRNSELQASRNICAKTVSKLQSIETQLQLHNPQISPQKSDVQIFTGGSFSQSESKPPSLTSMSEDGNDDEVSCSGSWSTTLISDLSQSKKVKNGEKSKKAENANHMELMDDFLEMEKLAYLSNDSTNTKSEIENPDALVESSTSTDLQPKEQPDSIPLATQMSTDMDLSALDSQSDISPLPLVKLQSRISTVFESMSKDADMVKVLEDIRHVVQETRDSLHQDSANCLSKDSTCSGATCDLQACPEETEVASEKEISLSRYSKQCEETVHPISPELAASISHIHDFVLILGKEAMAVQGRDPDEDGLSRKLEEFSTTFDKVLSSKVSLVDFVLDLSRVLTKASELHFNVLGYKNHEAETISSDCIDKVALPENKVVHDSLGLGDRYPNGCAHFSDSTSDPDIPHEGNFVPTFEPNTTSWKCSLEEFEQMKLEKDNLVIDLTRCTENLESTKSQLQETEQLLAEVKSQLTSVQKLNSLAETQLKCMAESYKSLETRAEELQAEINILRVRTESLDDELQEERRSHQDALAQCKDLQEQLQRIESCPVADIDVKTKKERELEAAAEKLAECQETIFLLGKQLNALRPPTQFTGSPHSERSEKGEGFGEEEPTTSGMNLQDLDQAETDTNLQRVGSESPMDLYNSPYSPSDNEAARTLLKSPISSMHPKHRPTKSSSSTSSTPTPEKHSRGFSRFFSSKGKNDN
ncbi:filament-like plant protein 4 [Cornus florida]|uniref:filament-like plant protein 4 n=1 Tax=Cornus florida TaxID=4283 RepID=UPI00289FB9A0|nr:filament-like plant protein 4 [Cornus florida]